MCCVYVGMRVIENEMFVTHWEYACVYGRMRCICERGDGETSIEATDMCMAVPTETSRVCWHEGLTGVTTERCTMVLDVCRCLSADVLCMCWFEVLTGMVTGKQEWYNGRVHGRARGRVSCVLA